MAKIVFGEPFEPRAEDGKTFRRRIQSDGAVGRGRELVPEGGLQEVICKELPDALE